MVSSIFSFLLIYYICMNDHFQTTNIQYFVKAIIFIVEKYVENYLTSF
ncbi:hypothetical protein HMPREF3226_02735 [Prevotella corporis]|uniref:Uncharacterized protein n=1 Tax=Prevotella corporis TaxID=28128 RepID=A0A133PTU7_9BACT|nr:hypothetical protein HMPREF3226_02735 [Prevotella corporis]